MSWIAKNLCSLSVVLMLLLGPAATTVGPRPCADCPPSCPMHHTGRLGCHERPSLPCHGRTGVVILAATCGHGAGVISAPAPWRALIPDRIEVRPAPVFGIAVHRSAPSGAVAAPEPPTDPPRALPLVVGV